MLLSVRNQAEKIIPTSWHSEKKQNYGDSEKSSAAKGWGEGGMNR